MGIIMKCLFLTVRWLIYYRPSVLIRHAQYTAGLFSVVSCHIQHNFFCTVVLFIDISFCFLARKQLFQTHGICFHSVLLAYASSLLKYLCLLLGTLSTSLHHPSAELPGDPGG